LGEVYGLDVVTVPGLCLGALAALWPDGGFWSTSGMGCDLVRELGDALLVLRPGRWVFGLVVGLAVVLAEPL